VTKECPNCKKENLDSAGFCQSCGTKLEESTTNANTTEESGSGIGGFWNKQSNGGKAAIGIGVCCLGIILIVAISGMMSPDKTTTTTPTTTPAPTTTAPTSTNTTSTSSSSTASASGTQVRVTYSGSWTGNYGDVSGSQSVEGTGSKTFDISGSPDIVSAVFQKSGGGSGTLTVDILQNGQVLETKSTSAQYGVVSVSHSFL